MIFSLAIYAPPSSDSGLSAIKFAQAAVASGHNVYRVFFYHDGVHHGSALAQSPQDELDLTQAWVELKQQTNCDLCICVAAGVKRGIFTLEEAQRYEQDTSSINKHFNLVGLGDLIEMTQHCDRVMSFGAT